jgi:hypothetical protein
MIEGTTMDPWVMKIDEMERRIAILEREVAVLKEKTTSHTPIQKRKRMDSMSLDLASDSNL